jgi:hypothetical protein
LFTLLPLVACWRYEPREHLRPLAIARAAIPPSPLRDRVGYSDHDRFRGYFPIHFIPAYNLPVYASQRPLPDATQDSVRSCSLGFAAAAISDGRLQRAYKAQPAQIPACAANAPGSSLRSNVGGTHGVKPNALRRTAANRIDVAARLSVRTTAACRLFPLGEALPSTTSAGSCLPLFGRFLGVGSEEAPIEGLASVRHSNGTCSFPAFRFHEWFREVRREGIGERRVTLSTREWTFCFRPSNVK